MNKFLITIIKKIFPKELPKPTGRWNVENNIKQINYKVDLSNEDHCGSCGEYALSKIEFNKKQKEDNNQKDLKKKLI